MLHQGETRGYVNFSARGGELVQQACVICLIPLVYPVRMARRTREAR